MSLPSTTTLPAKSGPSLRRHRSKQDYVTPLAFVRAVERHLRITFTLDLAATAENTRVPEGWLDPEMNSLKVPWHALIADHGGGKDAVGWLNPPFDDIHPWAEKCRIEGNHGFRSVLLTPASVGSRWYAEQVHHEAMVLALQGRIQFEGATDPYPKDLMISLFGFGFTGFDVWKWK